MAATKVKVGDTVVVHTGKDKGLRGKVLQVMRDVDRVIVEGVNRVQRHQKAGTGAGSASTAGGIITKEAALHISNVRVVESGDAKADKKAAKAADKADKKAAKAAEKADKKAAKTDDKSEAKASAGAVASQLGSEPDDTDVQDEPAASADTPAADDARSVDEKDGS